METVVMLIAILALATIVYVFYRVQRLEADTRMQQTQAERLAEERMNTLLARLGEIIENKQRALSEALHRSISEEQTRLADFLQNMLKNTTDTLNLRFSELSQLAERRLEAISGKVDERLNEGFEKTQKIFADVLTRLAVIDQAQERIAKLSENVVSLQDVLDDKRARGVFGEVQLANLVRQVLPQSAYQLQAKLPNGRRVDCLLLLPDPIGKLCVDAKFPLESYQRMTDRKLSEGERRKAAAQFKLDIKKHIDDIANRYIIPGTTSDGAIMFLPSEAVFAELHAHHPELIQAAHAKRVWIVSPTTMMAVLTTVAAVLKDAETRKQVHIIQEHLHALAKDFERFSKRFEKLATHIRQAHEDTEQIHRSAKKITDRFSKIERVELQEPMAIDKDKER